LTYKINKQGVQEGIGQNIFSKIDERFYNKKSFDYNSCITKSVDLVINGVEIASGGERENNLKRFRNNLDYLKIENYEKKYHYFIKALASGAPPYFALAIGWERLLWVLLEPEEFTDLFIFPKDNNGYCLVTKPD